MQLPTWPPTFYSEPRLNIMLHDQRHPLTLEKKGGKRGHKHCANSTSALHQTCCSLRLGAHQDLTFGVCQPYKSRQCEKDPLLGVKLTLRPEEHPHTAQKPRSTETCTCLPRRLLRERPAQPPRGPAPPVQAQCCSSARTLAQSRAAARVPARQGTSSCSGGCASMEKHDCAWDARMSC